MKVLKYIAIILVLIGALNWGFWGFFQWNPVAEIFGGNSAPWARIIYALVGLAGIWCIICLCRCKKCCSSSHQDCDTKR